MLTVAEYNLAGRRAYEKAGFKEMGRRRQADRMNGVVYDEIYMDCVASEFTSPVLAKIFVPDEPR
jgi:RimJ/RimL family protein N-acetyltransferase